MRLLGAALVLLGGGLFYRRRRGRELEALALGEALYGDLAALSYRVCVLRQPLPEIVRGLSESGAWEAMWGPLLTALEAGEEGPGTCWQRAAEALPPALEALLAPLGPLLSAGGARLDRAAEAVREDLAAFLRAERQRQAQQGRLTGAVCLAGSCLLILVLL